MSKVICYPKSCEPEMFEVENYYFEIFSTSQKKEINIGHVGNLFFRELKRSRIKPSSIELDFLILAMSVVAADKAVVRKNSADGWTRQIELTVYLHEVEKWISVKDKLEWMLRFLSGDFWKLNIKPLPASLVPQNEYPLRDQDCVCLLSGGMDSLVGAIDLHESGRNPLFVSQIVRGDAEHQREYAAAFGNDNMCQWSNYVSKKGVSENSTRARSLIFFAFALIATCGIKSNSVGKKEIFVPENGFISLNIALDSLRMGTLSTKTTHPVYMMVLQDIWNSLDLNVELVLPYKFKTKGEVLKDCKNQELMNKFIFGSTSCGKYQRHGLRHCGVCVPCMVRRAAFLKAGIEDETERGYCLPLKGSNSRDVAAAALAVMQIEQYGIESLIKSELSFTNGAERKQYVGMVERGIEEIGNLLKWNSLL